MNYFKKLLSYVVPYLKFIIIGFIFMLIVIITATANPYIIKMIIDEVIKDRNMEKLLPLTLSAVLIITVRTVVHYFRVYIFEYVSQKVLYDLRLDLYDKLQSQSFEFYNKIHTGQLMNRMVGDLTSVQNFIKTGFTKLVQGIGFCIFIICVMLSMNVKLTVAIMAVIPFIYLNTLFLSQNIRPKYKKIRNSFENLTSTVQENITGIKVVKVFGREELEKSKFSEVAKDFTDKNKEAADIRAKYAPFSRFLIGVGQAMILLFGGYLVMKNEMTVGCLYAFNSYIFMLSNHVIGFNDVVNQWQNASTSLEKIFNILEQESTIYSSDDGIVLNKVKGDIKLKNVFFKYNCKYILKNINLHMKPGSVTAIMGKTGSGKSTIINLIGRFYDTTEGKILIDGKNIKDIELNSLRNNIGIIFQDTFLFSDTIANNIAFGNPQAKREEIINAAQLADAHNFIMSMPEGYNTVVGERGVGLSGGQRQRIAIARTLLCNPRIIILDDATSSLDMETEYEIWKTLKKVIKQKTVLIVAHRISTVMNSDNIIFIEDGAIVESGTHNELMNKLGKYYNAVMEQSTKCSSL